MNSIEIIKFKKLISSEWLRDEEADFVLKILNITKDLPTTYDELVKMSNQGTSSVSFILVENNTVEQHYTKSTSILDKIYNIELDEEDITILKEN